MISIENLYYLLLYSWDQYDDRDMVTVDAEPHTDLVNMFAKVLLQGVDQLLRRGLDRGYLSLTETVHGVRGKMDFASTVKEKRILEAKTVCQFDELLHDVPHNQVLKATMRLLLKSQLLHIDLRSPIRAAYRRFKDVSDVTLTARIFSTIHLHRNISRYQLLLNVCRLIHNNLIPDPKLGEWRFTDLTRDEVAMRRIFESFLFNFYRHEQTGWKVRRPKLRWKDAKGDTDFLPQMRTDVVLEYQSNRLILEAKYTQKVFETGQYSSRKFRAAHLYQLSAYLTNFTDTDSCRVSGILIYPLARDFVDARFSIGGFPIRVYTLNLNQHWTGIRNELLTLTGTSLVREA